MAVQQMLINDDFLIIIMVLHDRMLYESQRQTNILYAIVLEHFRKTAPSNNPDDLF